MAMRRKYKVDAATFGRQVLKSAKAGHTAIQCARLVGYVVPKGEPGEGTVDKTALGAFNNALNALRNQLREAGKDEAFIDEKTGLVPSGKPGRRKGVNAANVLLSALAEMESADVEDDVEDDIEDDVEEETAE